MNTLEVIMRPKRGRKKIRLRGNERERELFDSKAGFFRKKGPSEKEGGFLWHHKGFVFAVGVVRNDRHKELTRRKPLPT